MRHLHVISISASSLSIGLAFVLHVIVVGAPWSVGALVLSPTSTGPRISTPTPAPMPVMRPTLPSPQKAIDPLAKARNVAQVFTMELRTGMKHPQVLELQRYLNGNDYVIVTDGPGSPGNETDLFGAGTRTTLARLQKDKGITGESGIVGPKTRKYLNEALARSRGSDKPTVSASPSSVVAAPAGEVLDPLLTIVRPTQPVTVEVSGPVRAAVGRPFMVYVTLKSAKDIDTARLNGTFDPTLLRLDHMSLAAFEGVSPGNYMNNANGSFSFGGFSMNKRVSGDRRIVALTFTAKKVGKASIRLKEGTGFYVAGEAVHSLPTSPTMMIDLSN